MRSQWENRRAKKIIEVDTDMIDRVVNELAKLRLRVYSSPKKSRRESSTIKKTQEIQETLQNSLLYARLKKSESKIISSFKLYN
jgi:hypothetical protein